MVGQWLQSPWAEHRVWTAAVRGALQAGPGRSVQMGSTHMRSLSFLWFGGRRGPEGTVVHLGELHSQSERRMGAAPAWAGS